jgi:hypothetical protein
MNDSKLAVMIILAFLMLNSAYGQENQPENKGTVIKPMKLEGPRVGVTFLSDKYVRSIEEEHDVELEPWVSQFGWQFEKRVFTVSSGFAAVTEWVLLVGGFEQQKFLPSLTWIIGARTAEGIEFGVGPNVTLSGTSVVMAAGITIRVEEINFPINLAIVSSQSGPRYSILFGFNIRGQS